MGSARRSKHKPEWYIQQDLIQFLEDRQWLADPTHGNLYQKGFPDLWCHHKRWGYRWIDCKVKGRYSFTRDQKLKWPLWESYGVGVWILTAADQEEYDKLFKPPNWRDYWKPQWGIIPDIDSLLDQITDEPG